MTATVVVGYDESPASQEALDAAAEEAELRGAELLLVHAFHWVVPATPLAVVPPGLEESCREAADMVVAHGLRHVRGLRPDLPVRTAAVAGDAAEEITAAAAGADLLVVGTRGRGGFKGLLLGSVAQRTVARADGPVLVVRGRSVERRGRILAAVDVAEPHEALLEFAFAEADRRGLALHAAHVWGDSLSLDGAHGDVMAVARRAVEDLKERVAALLEPYRPRFPRVAADAVVYTGSIGNLLVQASSTADLVVAGARRAEGRHQGRPREQPAETSGEQPGGHDAAGLRIGPAARTLLMHAECPVALVPIG